MGDTFNILGEFDHTKAVGQSRRQYQLTQPPFKAASQAVAPRDRYRVPRGYDEVYDMPEEDDRYGAGMQFDEFGEYPGTRIGVRLALISID
jgi:hypothetical protein